MTTTDSPIINLMIDRFNLHNTDIDSDATDQPFDLRDMITATSLTIIRADIICDIAIAHFDLDDELHDLTLIATYDRRDPSHLDSLLAHSDTELITIFNDTIS